MTFSKMLLLKTHQKSFSNNYNLFFSFKNRAHDHQQFTPTAGILRGACQASMQRCTEALDFTHKDVGFSLVLNYTF